MTRNKISITMENQGRHIRRGQCNKKGQCSAIDRSECPKPCGEASCSRFNETFIECICPDGNGPSKDLVCSSNNVVNRNSSFGAIRINGTSSVKTHQNQTGPHVSRASDPFSTEVVTAVAASAVLAVVVVVGLAIYLCKQWPNDIFKRRKKQSNVPLPLNKNVLMAQRYAANPQYSTSVPMQEMPSAPPGVLIIERSKLNLEKELGEGCFGKVFEGDLLNEDGSSRVAIKMLKSSASREAEEDFMREVEVMSSFHNDHILNLIGIVLRDGLGEPWMVFEFMAHGDLADVLRANSHALRRPTPGLPPLGPASLHAISMQVASGMAYLAEQHFVHRDLACRNCLVGDGLVVKIADFGMSRDVYTCDYYKVGGARLLPIRWMSPESILYGRYTLESDVWSFGVVLWEIFSLGRQPYYGYTNEEVVKLILQGSLLTPPSLCPPLVTEIMLKCWRREPKDRIKFPEINFCLQTAAPQNRRALEVNLPLPPVGLEEVQMLDQDQYLLPIPMPPPEYLQTLPNNEHKF
ncbi:muscle, skeletal receptor tyrosine-protein kinase-like [Neocloeon triangulifer]|uniref:muscle, skeletal receptor tyrosine-protein kinase-like n=1 Tax=Neocloeon triangulifer TaxID=2078957 RepID=UPI00286F4DB5|nr:muscle, skeletal receptor tyrosine-protein kinase-like [Neocloeon triangulifer]